MNWTIIGCGWLGTRLAETLLEKKEQVIGTTTSAEKQIKLQEKGIKSVIFNLNSQISTEIIDYSELVVLSIPPINKENPSYYSTALLDLVVQFKSTTQFIFLSSTGVYPQKNGTFTEDYEFLHDERNSSLFQAEKKLSDYLQSRLTILRLGGLFGEDRHPIFHLKGKSNIKNPEGKINFVGQSDIIRVILQLVKQQKTGEIYNIVYPEYPTRKNYYLAKAEQLQLPPPNFEQSTSIVREISSEKVQNQLNFSFKQKI